MMTPTSVPTPADATPSAARLVDLDPDHPGFRDSSYRARRDAIARLAFAAERRAPGTPVPDVDYTADEQRVWRQVWRALRPLHDTLVCPELRAAQDRLGIARSPAPPQLASFDAALRATGFRFEPVAGLVQARDFLSRLADGVFLATQYVRHPSRPFYTPEPDVLHELIGHAAGLGDERLAAVHRAFGAAARRVGGDDGALLRLERVYWYSIEYGLVAAAEPDAAPLAVGAGLLSSVGELARFRTASEHVPWDVERAAATPYDPTDFQPRLFVASSFDVLCADLLAWLGGVVSAPRTS